MLIDRLSTLAHPQRMAVFRLLMRRFPDALPAGEIAQALRLKASTTSVYLGALTRAELITQERQGTSLRYALDLAGAQGMVRSLFLDCCGGRPDLCPPEFVDPFREGLGQTPQDKFNVLFICTGNSARSIFAEALLRDLAGDRFNVFSAGTFPSDAPHPLALATLEQAGVSIENLRSQSLAEFQGQDAPIMQFVFTVCDQAANEECPAWPGQPITAHWGLPDPAKVEGSEVEHKAAFRAAFEAMKGRIEAFAALPIETLSGLTLQAQVDGIGREIIETKD